MTPISGPQDVGGSCPSSTFQLFNRCCCDFYCCWSACDYSSLDYLPQSPPLDCLEDVPNAQWYYDPKNEYFSAIIIN